ncbi:MAG: glycogen/starch/alpha-glucan phosphorylase [Lentisphaerae bacterium]|nr:glycogen/starch/alpha-glucan phosphorylase [Lentisphaerota bacterium]
MGKKLTVRTRPVRSITARQILNRMMFHLKFTRCKDWRTATDFDKYLSLSLAIRDFIVERMIATHRAYLDRDVKRVYYLSMEYLLGRLLTNNIVALNVMPAVNQVLRRLGLTLDAMIRWERDAGLGNGGLGRLAACFLDSMATLELPAYGYGLRYEHGMFRQEIEDGWQKEEPDDWLKFGYPWEMVRPEYIVPVRLYGRIAAEPGTNGKTRPVWVDWQMVEGVPYDIPVIGYGVNTVNFLRLWQSRAHEGFRLDVFNRGDYVRAVQEQNWAEGITQVLYPSDNTSAGKELRLIQEYFLVVCSIRDLIRRYRKNHREWSGFARKNAIQLNDTHPALAIVELLRFFVDEAGLPWEEAWTITTKTFGFTNHTLMPEALEKWSVSLLEKILPRHLQLIYAVNQRFLQQVEVHTAGNLETIRAVSLIEEGAVKQVRMANLAIVGSHSVNGVSELHTRLIKSTMFRPFTAIWPDKFNNKTNGITPRRWLLVSNPGLAGLISGKIGHDWIRDLDRLRELERFADDADFQQAFAGVKRQNKARLAALIAEKTNIRVDPDALFDVQVKRLHEYKRQFLNALHVVTLYHRLKRNPDSAPVPRVCLFAAKAAPNYYQAKLIIKFITAVAGVVNRDPDVGDRLKVVFLPDYDVSLAETIIPGADLSEQISTAGMEASGTGNMKLALNGALTIGTRDGANIEILEEVGPDNIFIFGHTAEELMELRKSALYRPADYVDRDAELREVIESIRNGHFAQGDASLFTDLVKMRTGEDRYFHMADYRSYVDCQGRVEAVFRNRREWARKAIVNVARMGRFSSDRTVSEYARDIWGVKPLAIQFRD